MHHTFPCNCLIFPSRTHHTPHTQTHTHTLAGTPPTENNEIIGRVGSSIIKLPKHNDVQVNGQYFFLPAEPSLFSVSRSGRTISILIQAIPFFTSYTYHIHAYYTHSNRSVTMHSSSTIITLAFYILPFPTSPHATWSTDYHII